MGRSTGRLTRRFLPGEGAPVCSPPGSGAARDPELRSGMHRRSWLDPRTGGSRALCTGQTAKLTATGSSPPKRLLQGPANLRPALREISWGRAPAAMPAAEGRGAGGELPHATLSQGRLGWLSCLGSRWKKPRMVAIFFSRKYSNM